MNLRPMVCRFLLNDRDENSVGCENASHPMHTKIVSFVSRVGDSPLQGHLKVHRIRKDDKSFCLSK